MFSMGLEKWPTLTGRQEPENLVMSSGDTREGREVVELGRRAGSSLLPWQCGSVIGMSMRTPAGTWVHQTCLLIVPRQNGKSEVIVDLILYRVFVLDETVLYTAHEWKSAQPIAERLIKMIEMRPSLAKRVKKINNSQGEAKIILKGPASPNHPRRDSKGNPKIGQVVFRTRSAKAGRGLDEVDTLIYDEAFDVSDEDVASIGPTQDVARDPQVIYASSAVDKESDTHRNGVQLSSLRALALSGDDPAIFLAEYRAPEGADRDDVETWRLANPSFGVLKSERKIKNLMRNMNSPTGRKSFDVEALGIGDYFTFGDELEDDPLVIDLDHWADLVDTAPEVLGPTCLAVDFSNDLTDRTASVAVAVRTLGGVHVQLGYHGPAKVATVVDFIVEASRRNGPVAVVIDKRSAAAVLIKPLIEKGIEPEEMTAAHVTSATAGVLQRVADYALTHDDDERLVKALEVAKLRQVGDAGYAWARRKSDGDICQLVAVTNAVWGLDEFDVEDETPAAPGFEDDTDINTTGGLVSAGFMDITW